MDEAGRASSSKLSTVLGSTPTPWAATSEGLAAFVQAADQIGDEGDPRAIALRFVGIVAATHAASATTNAEVFEATAAVLHRVATDLKRFGWVKGSRANEPANENVCPGARPVPLMLQIAGES